MGPNTRGGKRGHKGISKETEVEIENALSEAMTDMDAPTYKGYSEMSGFEKFMDKVGNKARQYQDTAADARGAKKFRAGGAVEVRPGDVRDNPKRGQCY